MTSASEAPRDGLLKTLSLSLRYALPVMLGYVMIGLPCGLMENAIGFSPVLCFVLSCTFYSGAGQFMIPNLWLAGVPLYSIIASVSFVNTRQILYAAAFAPYFSGVDALTSFLFSATVTDESFGVNMERFQTSDSWTALHALLVNVCCMLSWATANALGCLLGSVLNLPLAITSFAMTSIFICLLVGQKITKQSAVVIAVAAAGVVVCKLVGLSGPAILLGAVFGVVAGMVYGRVERGANERA